jgi:hypothetical protein
LTGADASLAAGRQVDDLQSVTQEQVAVLEYGAGVASKRLATAVALAEAVPHMALGMLLAGLVVFLMERLG